MSVLPKALQNLIEEMRQLPGVGPRTAERYAYHVLKASKTSSERLARALSAVHENVTICPKTFVLMEKDNDVSPLYADEKRDKTLVAVVEDPLDVVAIEKTGKFSGTYHVLGGTISPIDGVGPEQLHVKELLERVSADKVQEVILATNASVEGESTALYVQKQLLELQPDLLISRLARGLPVGVDLEYADQITLSRALEGRQSL